MTLLIFLTISFAGGFFAGGFFHGSFADFGGYVRAKVSAFFHPAPDNNPPPPDPQP